VKNRRGFFAGIHGGVRLMGYNHAGSSTGWE
jgi:hypothetical protein